MTTIDPVLVNSSGDEPWRSFDFEALAKILKPYSPKGGFLRSPISVATVDGNSAPASTLLPPGQNTSKNGYDLTRELSEIRYLQALVSHSLDHIKDTDYVLVDYNLGLICIDSDKRVVDALYAQLRKEKRVDFCYNGMRDRMKAARHWTHVQFPNWRRLRSQVAADDALQTP